MLPSAAVPEPAVAIVHAVEQMVQAHSPTEVMPLLVMQLALIIIAARMGGFFSSAF